jgi:hypothetical protein
MEDENEKMDFFKYVPLDLLLYIFSERVWIFDLGHMIQYCQTSFHCGLIANNDRTSTYFHKFLSENKDFWNLVYQKQFCPVLPTKGGTAHDCAAIERVELFI